MFVPKGPINNIPALIQMMAWRRIGGKPLSEPMMVNLLMHICVTLPQWVNTNVGGPYRTLFPIAPFMLALYSIKIEQPAGYGSFIPEIFAHII